LVDIIIIKGILDVAFRRKELKWTSAKIARSDSKDVVTVHDKDSARKKS
jgi:hypothetical protein